MAEAIEAVNGSDATNLLIPNATPKILAALWESLQNLVRLGTNPVSSAVELNNLLQ